MCYYSSDLCFLGGGPVSPVLQGHTYYFNFIYGMPDLGELSG